MKPDDELRWEQLELKTSALFWRAALDPITAYVATMPKFPVVDLDEHLRLAQQLRLATPRLSP